MNLVDRVITSLRSHHDELAGLVPALDAAALGAPSGAAEWRVSDVLSHLGSGAEIMLRPVAAAVTDTTLPAAANEEVWERWNAMAPTEQAAEFAAHDDVLVTTLEGLDDDARTSMLVDLGFLPAPVPLVMAAGMRLNEVVHHSWDVRVGLDPTAVVDEEAADLLLDLLAGPLAMLLGFSTRADAVSEPVTLLVAGHGLAIGESVELFAEPPVAPTATFSGPTEAFVRLLSGRLRPDEDGVDVTGNVTLDELRAVFPGY